MHVFRMLPKSFVKPKNDLLNQNLKERYIFLFSVNISYLYCSLYCYCTLSTPRFTLYQVHFTRFTNSWNNWTVYSWRHCEFIERNSVLYTVHYLRWLVWTTKPKINFSYYQLLTRFLAGSFVNLFLNIFLPLKSINTKPSTKMLMLPN